MLKIYGYSDDNVEVEGDIVEEFLVPYSGDGVDVLYLGLSNGMYVKAMFGQGWSFGVGSITNDGRHVMVGNYSIETDEEGDQILTIHDDISWIVAGDRFEKKRAK